MPDIFPDTSRTAIGVLAQLVEKYGERGGNEPFPSPESCIDLPTERA